MKREWEPGDVGLNCGNRVFRTDEGWQFVDGPGIEGFSYDVRPLVVIDPEDREQVERLARLFRDHLLTTDDLYPGLAKSSDSLAVALREFADPKPPKPDEPTGLGAVVEDASGVRWVRARDEEFYWRRSIEDGRLPYQPWAEIDAVRVLSEGVTL